MNYEINVVRPKIMLYSLYKECNSLLSLCIEVMNMYKVI